MKVLNTVIKSLKLSLTVAPCFFFSEINPFIIRRFEGHFDKVFLKKSFIFLQFGIITKHTTVFL